MTHNVQRGSISLDGMATLGHVRGRDVVGTCSDGAKPNLPYHLSS